MSANFMLALVGRGLAICLLPAGSVPQDPALRAIPLTDGPCRMEYIAWDHFNPSPAALAFIDHVSGSIRQAGAEPVTRASAINVSVQYIKV